MMEDDNDFMGSSLHNYDITENRMSGTEEEPGVGCDHEKIQFKVAGNPTSTGRVVAGAVVLVLCEIIALATKVDGEFGLTSFVFIVGGLVASFMIWLKK